MIEYADWEKIDLRVAEVVSAERIENSEKLIKLVIDLGNEKRTLVAGIYPHYKPEELIGKQIVIIANLKPRKLMGVESQGMLLATESSVLITPEKSVKNGERIL